MSQGGQRSFSPQFRLGPAAHAGTPVSSPFATQRRRYRKRTREPRPLSQRLPTLISDCRAPKLLICLAYPGLLQTTASSALPKGKYHA
ncbi:hypothetical protein LX32DRAFT_639157 [Colletotrichum zoysiae]|uniref:Uncharacterized protein n=1 Tax=Colletotrichum zoysiae TaxID=1216348 RepID=A0AAD9M572_9PEZI|nr:hypothetical protein LX32DRAFT_639157 [Colletotrichum zoysiae]